MNAWSTIWNVEKLSSPPREWPDFLKPEYKDKLVLTHPADGDAIGYIFDLVMHQYGYEWVEGLLKQNPRWVRGTATPVTIVRQASSPQSVTFTSSIGLKPIGNLSASFPSQGIFVSWPRTIGIFEMAPHPEGAKLFANWLLSDDFQKTISGWSARSDITPPAGYPKIMDVNATNSAKYVRAMADSRRTEALRMLFEEKIGMAKGPSPLKDNI